MNKVRANQIATKALQIRKKYLDANASVPICAFNLADAMGFDIRFVKISSFEGMYIASESIILISAERPEGRKRFTCAHELGHHVLGHGTVIDEIIEIGANTSIEREADFFGSMLLMPSSAVARAASDMEIDLKSAACEDIYTLSKYLGVSYKALLTQLRFNLNLLSYSTYEKVKNPVLSKVKYGLCGLETGNEVFTVGSWWRNRAIDVVVGDYIVPQTMCQQEGISISACSSKSGVTIFEAISPGISKLTDSSGWSVFVRVCRKNYSGMYHFRHEEEIE